MRYRLRHVARSPLVRLVFLGLVLGFAFQGTRGLWSPDEGRYVDGALQMLDSGNFLAPAYSPSRANFSKPPVTYWLIAASIKAFGHNTWAARAPYAIAFVLTLLVLYAIGRRLIPEKPWLPGLIYACTAFPFFTANIISTDVFLTLFEALAMFGFLRLAFAVDERRHSQYVLVMWLGFGLAFLTKGPPGLIPLLAVVPFIVSRDGWRGLERLFTPAGIAAFLIVGLLWYFIVVVRYPWVAHYFLHQEVYERIFTAAQRRHPGPYGWIVAYLPTLTLGSIPWWPSLIRGIRSASHRETWRTWRHQHSAQLFLLLWFVIPLIVFCLAQSRLPLYVLPLFVPLSLMLALDLRRRIDLGAVRQRAWLCAWVLVLLAVKGVIAYFAHPATDDRLAARRIAAMTTQASYSAVAFVENTDSNYAIEEQTPWGMRLYMNKPVYGVAWRMPQGSADLCQAVRNERSLLMVVAPSIEPGTLRSALTSCHTHAVRVGTWRNNALEWVQA